MAYKSSIYKDCTFKQILFSVIRIKTIYSSFQLVMAVSLLTTGEIWDAISFCQRHPQIIPEILTFGVASAFGQNFIFITVSEFGPLMCSIMTTTRKFFTILGSVVLFGNTLMTRQWIGTAIVFAGLILNDRFGKTVKAVKGDGDKKI